MKIGKKYSKPQLSRLINGDISIKATPEPEPRHRLDKILSDSYPTYTRSTLQQFIKSGHVTLNGQVITKPSTLITATDIINLQPPPTPKHKPKLPIIYEDPNVLVLDKPAGLLSMSKGAANPEPTLEDYGLLVHRLDRATSGVIILAKNDLTKKYLQKQFQNHKTKKTYYAVTTGQPKVGHALIKLPIARNLKKPTTFQVDASGREAITEYTITKRGSKYTLLELKPITGRTHQLRVHLKYINAPILGDPIYGDRTKAPRLFLHAHQLEITIPGGIRKIFTSPLPQEFSDVL